MIEIVEDLFEVDPFRDIPLLFASFLFDSLNKKKTTSANRVADADKDSSSSKTQEESLWKRLVKNKFFRRLVMYALRRSFSLLLHRVSIALTLLY